jgi:molybdopterin converting factor small subunit
MARVTIRLPGMLAEILGGISTFDVEARTLQEALDAAIRKHPALKVHWFDETGRFRTHVLCFHNKTNTRWLDSLEGRVGDGDTITILQAVSGG